MVLATCNRCNEAMLFSLHVYVFFNLLYCMEIKVRKQSAMDGNF